jgi:glycosyltransferase involved in cell wall biosynthesis
MKVSAIITTKNRTDLFKRAIKSIFSQTVRPEEIIVIEDGGDYSVENWIEDNYHNDVIFFRQMNSQGLSSARNKGLELAKHDLIAFLDDDDEWLPRRLEEQLSFYKKLNDYEKENLACIQVGCNILNENNTLVSVALPVHFGNMKESIINFNGIVTHSSCFLFSRKALISVNGFDNILKSGIDHDIWMKLAVKNYISFSIKIPLVNVYIDSRETMMKNTNQRLEGTDEFVKKWGSTFIEWFDNSFPRRYYILVISGLMGVKLSNFEIKDSILIFKNLISKSRFNFKLNIFLFSRVFKVYLYHKHPYLRHLKRKLFKTNHVQT